MVRNGTGRSQLSRQAVDETLAALTADHQRIAAALYAMDTHPAHTLLSAAPTAGRTALAWAQIRSRMGEVWADFTAFGIALDAARAARARRTRLGGVDLGRLTELLSGPVVTIAAAPTPVPLPVAARHLVDCCMNVTVTFDQIATAADAVAARLVPIASAIAAAERLAAEVGDPPAVSTGRRTEFAEVSAVAVADPLGATEGETDAVLRRLADTATAARDRLTAAVELKSGLAARRAASSAAIDDLAAAEETVRAAYAVAHEKIADPGLPAPPAAAPELRVRWDGLRSPVAGPPGSAGLLRFGADLDDLDRAVAAARERADLLRTAADGLIERRAELRGRLDAYRIKAARLGFSEHPDLSARHRAAHDLLYTRPCDLPAATRAVHGYQQLLATLAGGNPAARQQDERTRR
ncbi:hypothetical protein [Virgisporangium aurantiacum]|uniref:Uncharacterized protein n=1 Tax=Virgisporangium aurantiacum TaxID=175570 RepID=A0A8J3ZHR0_9ACTN|nr:hypothetical protein [Virgisporangium aurantiacum]GIJ61775.1 hypothetical protein Vau01_092910 [Virgisporangium aurantiacum]